MANQQVRRYEIRVDTKNATGLKDLANQFGILNKQTKSMSSNMGFLTNAFRGWLGFLGLREITRMSDEMQNLENRLKLVSREGEDISQTMRELLELADETQQPISTVAQSYSRLAVALKHAKPSSQALNILTKTLINTFRLSAATTTETANTMIQLSQAFASGELRGQELRAVMEQNAELAGILRERFGPGLMRLAEKDIIKTSDAMDVLRENMGRVNAQAKELTPTFEQTTAKAFNRLTFAIGKFNKELGLSSLYAKSLDFMTEKMTLMLSIVGVLALTQLPKLIEQIKLLDWSIKNFATKNWMGIALMAVSVLIISTNKNLDDFIDKWRNLGAWIVHIRAEFLALHTSIELKLARGLEKIGMLTEREVERLQRQVGLVNSLRKRAWELGTPTDSKGGSVEDATEQMKKEFDKMNEALRKIGGQGAPAEKLKEILGAINTRLLEGKITLSEYNKEIINFDLFKLNREFREGKFDIFTYNERLKELRLQDLNRELEQGRINFIQYNALVRSVQMEELTAKFEAGRISLAEYHKELSSISEEFMPNSALISGTSRYLESIGTLSSNIADGVENVFKSLEESLVQSLKSGKLSFEDFANAVIEDIARIAVRAAIVRPLMQGILGMTTGGDGGGTGLAPGASNGPATPINTFAKGGIVDSPTFFRFAKGKTGLAGEAGPEAIIPLKRSSNGELGVQAQVTPVNIEIINTSGAQVDAQESTGPNGEKQIKILVQSAVKEGIASGAFDKDFRSSYGLNRKGM